MTVSDMCGIKERKERDKEKHELRYSLSTTNRAVEAAQGPQPPSLQDTESEILSPQGKKLDQRGL